MTPMDSRSFCRQRRRLLRAAVVLGALTVCGARAADLPQKFDPSRDAARDLDIALDMARETGRRVLVDVGGEWCTWCHIFDRFFNTNADLKRLRDNWYVVLKVNWSPENTNAALLKQWPKIKGYPHLFVLDAGGKLVHSQDTAALESGKSYDPAAMRAFLVRWAPGARPSA
jgi:thiol:disulfide interchange protein